MKLITYLTDLSQIQTIKDSQVTQVILGPKNLTRFGTLTNSQVNMLAKELIAHNIMPILEWDILMTQNTFELACDSFKEIEISLFKEIRLADPGAIHFVINHYPELKIQLLLESGAYHNTTSLEVMKGLIGNRLSRVVLSLELNFDYLSSFIKESNVEVEFLGLGRILLFYTPRKLITPLFGTDEKSYYEVNEIPVMAKASSEESAHKGFPVIENMHGTFMFNTKDHFVLEFLKELIDINLHVLRIDLRFENDYNALSLISQLVDKYDENLVKKIKENHSTSVIRGFFHTNKTDVLFKKLKNQKLKRVDESYIGEVIDVVKGSHILVQIKSKTQKVVKDQIIFLTTTEGKVKELKVNSIKNTRLIDIDEASYNELILLPYVSGATVRSILHTC